MFAHCTLSEHELTGGMPAAHVIYSPTRLCTVQYSTRLVHTFPHFPHFHFHLPFLSLADRHPAEYQLLLVWLLLSTATALYLRTTTVLTLLFLQSSLPLPLPLPRLPVETTPPCPIVMPNGCFTRARPLSGPFPLNQRPRNLHTLQTTSLPSYSFPFHR